MKILFFPSDLGGGFGHISRCLALAQEATSRGHSCAFVMNDTKFKKTISGNFKLFTAQQVSPLFTFSSLIRNALGLFASTAQPVFTEISGLDFQVLRDGLINKRVISNNLEDYHKIVNTFKPDILIGDTNLLVWILGKKTSIPVTQIVRYASHPATAKLIWWKNVPDGIVSPNASALFNPFLEKMKLELIGGTEDLLRGDLFIIPSLPEIEPIAANDTTIHVGPLALSDKDQHIPHWFHDIDDQTPLVYITLGGGAGPVGNKLFFTTIINTFSKKNVQVVVSTSNKFNLKDLPSPPPNIRFFNWVPGKLLISRADLVLFHGGYSTMMESVSSGKPTITIPFHSEQEGNGRRLEHLGCGCVMKMSKEPFHQIKKNWQYGAYSYLVQNRYDLTSEELNTVVDTILLTTEYRNRAQLMQTKAKEYHGPRAVLDLLEKHWR